MRGAKLFWVLMALTGLLVGRPASAATNFALTADGASFVAASSHNAAANKHLVTMQDDILTNSPRIPWNFNGDARYIFGHGDQDQWIEISLGQIRSLDSIGAAFNIPYTDRWVVGPFSVETSTDGVTWDAWGSPVTVTHKLVNPVLIGQSAPEDVEYIKYFFGPTGPDWGHDGSAVYQLFAFGSALSSVPEPGGWALMLTGMGVLGVSLRVRRRPARA